MAQWQDLSLLFLRWRASSGERSVFAPPMSKQLAELISQAGLSQFHIAVQKNTPMSPIFERRY